MKNSLLKFALLSALAVVFSLTGCKDDDIKQLQKDVTDLKGRIAILETFKAWTETTVTALQGKDTDLQAQIDQLKKDLEDAIAAGSGVGDPTLKAQLEEHITNTMVAITQINGQLDDHADLHDDHLAALEDLYEQLEALGANDVVNLMERMAALEKTVNALDGEIDDIWATLGSLGNLGQFQTALTALQAKVAALEEQVNALLASLIKSITYVPNYSDGQMRVDGILNGNIYSIPAFEMKYLVTPANLAEALVSAGTFYGLLNTVTPVTRAIQSATVPATATVSEDETGVIVVKYSSAIPSALAETVEDGALQIALRVEGDDDLASSFVTLLLNGNWRTPPPIELSTFWQNDTDPVDVTENNSFVWGAPEASTPDGMIDMSNEPGEDLTLNLVSQDEDDWARLINPVTTYRLESQFQYNGSAWVDVDPATVELEDGVLSIDAKQAADTRVVISMEVADDNTFDEKFYFTVNIVGEPIVIDDFHYGTDLTLDTAASIADAVESWSAPVETPAGMPQYNSSNPMFTFLVDYRTGNEADYARLDSPLAQTTVAGQYEWDGSDWVQVAVTANKTNGSTEDVTMTVPGSARDARVVLKMEITDDNGFNLVRYYAVDVPATLVDLSTATFTASHELALRTRAGAIGEPLVHQEFTAGTHDHTLWEGGHTAWDAGDDNDKLVHLNFLDQLTGQFVDTPSASGVTATGLSVSYAVVALLNEDGGDHLATGEISIPTLGESSTGNATLNRNNGTFGKSNHGHYVVVSATFNATNAVAQTTHFYCFHMQNGHAPLPTGITAIPQGPPAYAVGTKTGNNPKPFASDYLIIPENRYDDGVEEWGDDRDAREVPYTPAKLDFEEKLEAHFPGADITVTYEKVGQYYWRSNRSEWTSRPTNGQNGNYHASVNSTTGAITPGSRTTHDNEGNQGYGDRMIIKVTAKSNTPAGLFLNGEIVCYICVALP